jgi:hypothetical protein
MTPTKRVPIMGKQTETGINVETCKKFVEDEMESTKWHKIVDSTIIAQKFI